MASKMTPLPGHQIWLDRLVPSPRRPFVPICIEIQFQKVFKIWSFYRASAHWRAILIYQLFCTSVRLSVRYVPVWDENGLTYRHSFFHRTPNHSSFIIIKYLHEIPTGSPPAGALNTGGVYKFRDFLPISRYISQTIQDIAKENRKQHPSF